MKKEKFWKYMSLILSVVTIVLLVYSYMFPVGAMSNLIEVPQSSGGVATGVVDLSEIENLYSQARYHLTPVVRPYGSQPLPMSSGIEEKNEVYDGYVYVGLDLIDPYTVTWWSQGIVFDTYPDTDVTGYQVLVGRHGTPTHPLRIGIASPIGLDEYWDYIIDIPPSACEQQDTLYWLGAMFEDSPYTPSVNLMILAAITGDTKTDGNYWVWGISTGNDYPKSIMCAYHISDNWVQIPGTEAWDTDFRVYTAGSSPPPQEPVISISVSTYVVTAGLITMLGAALSSVKYASIVGWI